MTTALPDVRRWTATHDPAARPWLLLGKGRSFDRLNELRTADYVTCALNHSARELPVDIAHVVDIEVVADAGEAIERQARALFMPWQPHSGNRVAKRTLAQWCDELPVLDRMAKAGKLFWYNLSSGKPHGDAPLVHARYFSAEAALDLCTALGATVVRSLGVDGGREYAEAFADLRERTLLSSGHDSFDGQFAAMARIIWRRGIDYAPAFADSPVRVLIGRDPTQRLATKVLEHSIVSRTPRSVQFLRPPEEGAPQPREVRNRPRTGFSFQRFMIPELCDRQGRAIYLDADMLVFDDLTKLWEWPMGDAWLAAAGLPPDDHRRRQFSVLLLDCARLDWHIDRIVGGLDDGSYNYRQLMYEFCLVPDERVLDIPPEWNSLEFFDRERTQLLHLTDLHRQPWVRAGNPNGEVWYAALRAAIEDGYLPLEEFHEEVRRGHVSPELPRWAGLPGRPDKTGYARDWTPPYRRAMGRWQLLKASIPGPLRSRAGWALNNLRRRLRQS